MSTEDDSQALIEAAAEHHDVDLDHAVVARDEDPASDRVYIIEDNPDDGYRLISFGLDAEGRAANEEPMVIPDSAVGGVQGLLHAAGLHLTNREFVPGPGGEERISIRDLSEGMNISKPLDSEEGDQQ